MISSRSGVIDESSGVMGFLANIAASGELGGVASWMTSLIGWLGAVGVGVIILVETVFPPIPSEIVLPAAGYLAGLGELNLVATVVWATVGSVLGALVLYWAGAALGAPRLGRIATRLPLMSSHDVERAWSTFDRWRQSAVFWGRLIPGVRSLVSIPAGAQRMPLVQFTMLTAAGSLIWNSILIGAGWWLGDRYGATAQVSHWLNVVILVGALAFVAWFVVRTIRTRRRAVSTGQPEIRFRSLQVTSSAKGASCCHRHGPPGRRHERSTSS